MDTFVWNGKFLTEIAEVDDQHRHLVSLINRFGNSLASGQDGDAAAVDGIFKELAAYAMEHFHLEERLMLKTGCDRRHCEAHVRAHREFVKQVVAMREVAGGRLADSNTTLLQFLTGWLTFHILRVDQSMARQIHLIESGTSPEDAYAIEEDQDRGDNAAATLLAALQGFYKTVTERNDELNRLNASLETRVEERTRTLTETVHRLEETRNQLLQSEKMASIGQLAAGVAHEINNPIGYVSSNLGTLERYLQEVFSMLSTYESVEDALPADVCADLRMRKQAADLDFLREDINSLLSESKEGVTRVTKIVKDLKDFSHVDNEDEWQWADLHGGIDSTLNIVWNELKYKCEVKKEYGVLPEIQCLPSQLNQVFMNMLINAGHAIVERGTIVIRTGVAAEQVWVEIEDSGKGIAPEHVQKIFDPFFTTKPVGKGTGLGLSLAYGIVQKHRGRIEVKSVPEKGTTFRVWLPQRQTAEAAPAAAASIVAAPA
jgi:hemerythrin-like metal-binding protein